MTGFELDYMTDEIANTLITDLKDIKEKVINFGNFNSNENSNKDLKVIISSEDKNIIRTTKNIDLTPLGQILKNELCCLLMNLVYLFPMRKRPKY